MPLQSIEPRRLYRKIADQLRTLIRDGEYGVGSRLPAERDLAVQLGVSRPSVREALIALEVEGLVEVRPGSGVHVVARETPRQRAPCRPRGLRLVRDLPCARTGRRRDCGARRAPGGRRVAGRTRVGSGADGTEIARGVMPIAGDRRFHLSIAEASDNGPLLRTVAELYDMRNSPLFEQFGQHFESARQLAHGGGRAPGHRAGAGRARPGCRARGHAPAPAALARQLCRSLAAGRRPLSRDPSLTPPLTPARRHR